MLLRVGHTTSVSQLVVFAPRVGKVETEAPARAVEYSSGRGRVGKIRFIKSLTVKFKKFYLPQRKMIETVVQTRSIRR